MIQIVIDLETYSTNSNAAIVQIGAVAFDASTGEITAEFKINVDPKSCTDAGLSVDIETMEWWSGQSREAQKSITQAPRYSILDALTAFASWVREQTSYKHARIWSHATFDFVILANAFKAVGMKMPYSHRSARDLRTIVDLARVEYWKWDRGEGVHHDALDDCRFQVRYLNKCFDQLRRDTQDYWEPNEDEV